jgi:hypothetical protein
MTLCLVCFLFFSPKWVASMYDNGLCWIWCRIGIVHVRDERSCRDQRRPTQTAIVRQVCCVITVTCIRHFVSEEYITINTDHCVIRHYTLEGEKQMSRHFWNRQGWSNKIPQLTNDAIFQFEMGMRHGWVSFLWATLSPPPPFRTYFLLILLFSWFKNSRKNSRRRPQTNKSVT